MDIERHDFGIGEPDWPADAPAHAARDRTAVAQPNTMLDTIGEDLLARRLAALTPAQSLAFKTDWIGETGYAVAGEPFDSAQALHNARAEQLLTFLAEVSAREERLRKVHA